jgi:PDZ domain-containing protein/aspartyl protease
MYTYKSFYSFLVFFCLFLGIQLIGYSQHGFKLPAGKVKNRITFKLVNNLVIIPVEVNGKELSFLLDTGVNYTLLFSLYKNDSLEIKNVTPVKIRGLGEGGDIDALKSINNQFEVGMAIDNDHTIYVIFDQNINFSPRMGVNIHGVIGYEFFRDFVVKTDYDSEILTIYDPKFYKPKRCRSCETFEILFSNHKPYIRNKITSFNKDYDVTLLIDSGASDALWLFKEEYGIRYDPKNYFNDFLGLGLSGGVHGKRSKIDVVSLGSFSFTNVNVAYPDSLALRNLRLNNIRSGTLGSDILKRFTVIMDYRSKRMTLRKNSYFNRPFHYNMAGIVIEHDGIIPIKDVTNSSDRSFRIGQNNRSSNVVNIYVNPLFTFFLAPKFVVAEVREGSPAHLAGVLKGDELLSINGKQFYEYELQEINELFSSKSGRKIVLRINRNGIKFKKRFVLKEVL